MGIKKLKQMSKEEFLQLNGATEELYVALQNSKKGYITIQHSKTGEVHHGWTEAFGEGLGVRMDNPERWYITSTIKYINWEKGYFDTQNSRYKFKFEENYGEENENE